jgi:autoinducer 2-degrading protein
MHILLVNIHVTPECIDEFIKTTLDNVHNSIKEPGVLRFDFYQQAEDKSNFTLVEVYRTINDHALHRETSHYQVWKTKVEGMMAEPRQGIRYSNIYPNNEEWK